MNKIIDSILLRTKLSFFTVEYGANNPSPDHLKEHCIYVVGTKGFHKWVFLKCPCGCGDLLTLSLMKSHNPKWKLKLDFLHRPSLYPSIWKIDGCKSHFWIRNGRIKWILKI